MCVWVVRVYVCVYIRVALHFKVINQHAEGLIEPDKGSRVFLGLFTIASVMRAFITLGTSCCFYFFNF